MCRIIKLNYKQTTLSIYFTVKITTLIRSKAINIFRGNIRKDFINVDLCDLFIIILINYDFVSTIETIVVLKSL